MFARTLFLVLVFSTSIPALGASIPIANHPTQSVVFGPSPQIALRAPTTRYLSVRHVAEISELKSAGFSPLSTQWGTTGYSEVRFRVKDDLLAPLVSREFLQPLEKQKRNLMSIFQLSDGEYNRLAVLAYAIAIQETKLGRSMKYAMKENTQFVVTWMKEFDAWLDGGDYTGSNSRGPTQIKSVPALVTKYYGIEERDLKDLGNSAIATLGFLAQTHKEMTARAKDRERFHFINSESIYDYTLYGYFGGLRRVLRRAALGKDADLNRFTDKALDPIAVPEMNAYIRSVRQNIRWITVLQRSPRLK
ncbi:MAG: hypothetical protein V4760_15895 [Bdellovibrionota bacterium]